jgi:hypothetical protein
MHVELVNAITEDGLRLDGALHRAEQGAPAPLPADAFVFLHGVGGNFYSGSLFAGITPPLLAAGAAALWANTRGHDGLHTAWVRGHARQLGAAGEIVDECRYDVAAWVRLLADRGYRRIGLFGHSLGAIKAVYSQAKSPLDEVTCLIAASPPRLSYAVFKNGANREPFRDAIARSQQLVEQGEGHSLIEVRFPFPLTISAATFLDKYGPGEHYNVLEFAGDVGCPLLFTYGSVELAEGGEAFAGLPELLMDTRSADQRFAVETLAGANHNYSERHAELADTALRWLKSIT